MVEKYCEKDRKFAFDQIIYDLASDEDSHKILDECKFCQIGKTHFRVTCS